MIELIQFPWSPFCIVQRRILEYSGAAFKIINIPNPDRSLVWKLTRQRYYRVPIIKDGKHVIFETSHDSQVIAKYLDTQFHLNLFPKEFSGIDDLLWHCIENDIENVGFRLNDSYWKEFVPKKDQLNYLRYKERKFGEGCLKLWRQQQPILLEKLEHLLIPFELMLETRPFLLSQQPHFIDFDLYGILSNFLFSGHYTLPHSHTHLTEWYGRMHKLNPIKVTREKFRS